MSRSARLPIDPAERTATLRRLRRMTGVATAGAAVTAAVIGGIVATEIPGSSAGASTATSGTGSSSAATSGTTPTSTSTSRTSTSDSGSSSVSNNEAPTTTTTTPVAVSGGTR